MKRIYCISGLGADQRIFKRLSISGAELVPVMWPAYSRHDTMETYAGKVGALITDTDPLVIGMSFGGMIAMEIAKTKPCKHLFLISSAKTVNELPPPNDLLKAVINSGVIPAGLLTIPNRFISNLFGAETKDEKELLAAIISDTDGHFMKWALKALLSWHNITIPEIVTHIHGTHDKIIPPQNVRPDHWIEGGEHIMVYNRADEISRLIEHHLAQ